MDDTGELFGSTVLEHNPHSFPVSDRNRRGYYE
jgi:hypothetical protein